MDDDGAIIICLNEWKPHPMEETHSTKYKHIFSGTRFLIF